MDKFIMQNPVVATVFAVLVIAFFIFLAIKFVQNVGLEKIRATVYKGFLEAEHKFNHGENSEKFNYVVNLAKSAVPAPFNVFITENLLRKVIQTWYTLCKDLLDDGKINGSSIKEV